MNYLTTTKFASKGEKGNCLAAALASTLGIPISDVPEFEEMEPKIWKDSLHEWSRKIGVDIIFTKTIPKGFCIGIGRHSNGFLHAVILKDGAFHFDTNGSGEFYAEHRYCLEVKKSQASKNSRSGAI